MATWTCKNVQPLFIFATVNFSMSVDSDIILDMLRNNTIRRVLDSGALFLSTNCKLAAAHEPTGRHPTLDST